VLRHVSVTPASSRLSWLKVALVTGAVLIGAGVGIGIGISQGSGGTDGRSAAQPDPGVTFAPGARRAPEFSLQDVAGQPLSLAALRGRTVVLAFIDPVCRNLCPLEAKALNDTVATLPAASRPVVVAVSVNSWNQTKADLRLDRQKWHLVPGWRWALGTYAELASVWREYSIGVQVRTKTLGGVTVHQVDHTEAAYVIDPTGYERNLFLYPYRSRDVVSAVRTASAGRSASSQS